MNFTMVIADDEPVVLRSLDLFVKQEFPDISVIGLAEDGVELKDLLEKENPDLAIIDIRMPGLSGIEVMELMRSKGCRTHFIINTAYSDFDYVKKALDLKTDGYLLKPGKREEKIKVISQLCRTVENEREENRMQSSMTSALQVVNPYLGSEILLSIFSEQCDGEDFDVYLSINSIQFSCGCIETFLLKEKPSIDRRGLNRKLKKTLDGICAFLADVTSDGIMVMLFLPELLAEGRRKKWCEELAEVIAKTLEQYTGSPCLYGVGGVYAAFEDMSLSYRESTEQLKQYYHTETVFPADNADKIMSYVDSAKGYIERNFNRDISLMDCASHVGISSYYLSHIFRDKTENTFVEYLTAIRIAHAKALCGNRELTLKDISDRCGYINTTYFCKVFKRNVGMTIGEFRREALEDGGNNQ